MFNYLMFARVGLLMSQIYCKYALKRKQCVFTLSQDQALDNSILRLYKRMKPTLVRSCVTRGFVAHILNGENEASLAEAIFSNE